MTLAAGTATVMPRPIAAGVFGIARTTAPPQAASIFAIVMPAMIETTRVLSETCGFSKGAAAVEHLRFDGDNERRNIADRARSRIEPQALLCQRGNLGRRVRFDRRDAVGGQAGLQPAGQQCAAHLAGAGQHDAAPEGGQAL